MMVTLTKESASVLDKVDPDKDNFLLVGFRVNPPYNPVLLATKFMALPGQGEGTTVNDVSHTFAKTLADEPARTESPDTNERLIRQLQSLMSGERLARRELEVLNHVAKGSANKEIAHELNIGEQTVKNYMASIMCKLDAKNRTHAVTLAIRQGLISP